MNQQQTNRYYLTVDFGSQSLRAQVFNAQGDCLAKITVGDFEYQRYQGGQVNQHVSWFYKTFVSAVKQLAMQLTPLSLSLTDIDKMTITCMRNTFIALDEQGKPVDKAIVWQDNKDAQRVPKLNVFYRTLFTIANLFYPLNKSIRQLQQQAAINKFCERVNDAHLRIDKVCLLGGYLHYQLTDDLVDSSASTISHLPLNFKSGTWQPLWHWYYQALAVKPKWLPRLCPSGAVIGRPTIAAQQQIGLSAGCDVIAGGADKVMEMLGSGCYRSGDVHISLGSAVSVSVLTDKFIGAKPFFPAFPFVVKGLYCTEIMLDYGMLVISDFIASYRAHLKRLCLTSKWNTAEHALTDASAGKYEISDSELLSDLDNRLLLGKLDAGYHFDLTGYAKSRNFNTNLQRINGYSQADLPVNETQYVYQYKAILDSLAEHIGIALERLKHRLKLSNINLYVSGGGANSCYLLTAIEQTAKATIAATCKDQAGCRGAAIFLAYQDHQYASLEQAIRAFKK
ncbi:FGGY family carbohydrate kinase [Thalassotalea maritima]|uniref:FGGY family carbohydrate kinase n=1 Tax=Thalassotalea maritima TaxID=3242416 RepID=UPI0035271E33